MFSAHHSKSYGLSILFITLLFCGSACQSPESSNEKNEALVFKGLPKDIHKDKRPTINGQEIILKNLDKISRSRQVILVATLPSKTYISVTMAFEKVKEHWERVYPSIVSTIGKGGFAKAGQKTEGDLKTPTGIYPLVLAFGYAKTMDTRLPYRQATKNDYWVDDPKSRQYNRWVRGRPKTGSYELMRREDHQYEYGFVVEYNVRPVIKGKGSALFFHVWPHKDLPSIGCITMASRDLVKLLKWLDIRKKPVVIMGPRDRLLKGPL